MKLKRRALRGKTRIQFDLRQTLALPDPQTFQALPARPESEELFLSCAMRRIENHLAPCTPLFNRLAIGTGARLGEAARDLTCCMFYPRVVALGLEIPRIDRECERVALLRLPVFAPKLHAKILLLSLRHPQGRQKEHIAQFDWPARTAACQSAHGNLHIPGARNERSARLETMLGEQPLFVDAQLGPRNDFSGRIQQPLFQERVNCESPRCHPDVAPRVPVDHRDRPLTALGKRIQERIGCCIIHLARGGRNGADR